MEQNRPAPRRALSPKERRRRHRIRLVRNWTVFLLSCGAVMAVMTGGILWLLPRAYALIAPPTAFEAREYEGGAETDLSDKRLVLVNANLPLTEEPTPELAVADDATGVSLEAEAAAAYREMAEAAKQDEIELVLTAGYQDAAARQSAYEAAAQSYRESLAFFATQGSFDVWRAYLDVAEVLQGLADKVSKADRRQVADDLERAFSKTNERAFEKLVHMEDGEPQMVYDPPDIVPLSHFLSLDNQRRVRRSLVRMLDDYRATVRPPYQELLKNYRFIGAAQKVVGVGSVGTRCWVAAFSGNQMADPLVLQIKEANASVLERFCGRSPCLSHGERVVAGQRLMQTTSGVLLGWTHARDEHGRRRDYYVRQLWNWKMSVDLDHVSADELEIYGQLCAWTLARAHARTGDRVAMASYLGTSDKFDASMVSFAQSYADQNEADYEQFLKRITVS